MELSLFLNAPVCSGYQTKLVYFRQFSSPCISQAGKGKFGIFLLRALIFSLFFFVVAAGVNHNGWRLSVQSLHEQCIESPRCGPGVWCSESGHVQAGLLLHECWRSLAHLSTMIKWQMLCEVTLCPGELLMACTGFWPDPQTVKTTPWMMCSQLLFADSSNLLLREHFPIIPTTWVEILVLL